MNFKMIFLLFIAYSFIGWIMEVIATYPNNKCFVNRGFLIGPYCPIYGSCSIAMIYILGNVNNIFLLFTLSVIICSIGEYVTSYLMEKIFHARWWDYSNKKVNLNGRICLSNAIIFGVLGVLLIKYVNPFVLSLFSNISISTLNYLFYVIFILFIFDNIMSFKIILKIKSLSLKYVNLDNTKEITEKVKKILKDNILAKRIFKAFPNIRINIKNKVENIKNKVSNLKK